MVKWSGYVQQGSGVGTGVQLLTVEQEWLLLEADVKHSEVQNLFSLLNAVVTCFQCLKRVSTATELTYIIVIKVCSVITDGKQRKTMLLHGN